MAWDRENEKTGVGGLEVPCSQVPALSPGLPLAVCLDVLLSLSLGFVIVNCRQ